MAMSWALSLEASMPSAASTSIKMCIRDSLGVTLARLEGEFTHHHPFLYALRSDLLLGNLKLIMEPWDLGNLGWRTGQFSVPFAEWNDRFRDTARTFWLEDVDGGSDFGRISLQEMSTRLCGSADLFATEPGRGAPASINFVSCHDGFTLTDLTRYRSCLLYTSEQFGQHARGPAGERRDQSVHRKQQ